MHKFSVVWDCSLEAFTEDEEFKILKEKIPTISIICLFWHFSRQVFEEKDKSIEELNAFFAS